jgi:hypothetical protein
MPTVNASPNRAARRAQRKAHLPEKPKPIETAARPASKGIGPFTLFISVVLAASVLSYLLIR